MLRVGLGKSQPWAHPWASFTADLRPLATTKGLAGIQYLAMDAPLGYEEKPQNVDLESVGAWRDDVITLAIVVLTISR